MKVPGPPCSRWPVPEAGSLQHGAPQARVALWGGGAACDFPAAAARLLLAPPQARALPAGVFIPCSVRFGLALSWAVWFVQAGFLMWAFVVLGLPSVFFDSPWGTVLLVFWVIWVRFVDRADCVPVLLSAYFKFCGFNFFLSLSLSRSPYFWFSSSW